MPASELYDERYGPAGVFTVQMFMQRCTLKRQLTGCAIDCSSYDVEAFTNANIEATTSTTTTSTATTTTTTTSTTTTTTTSATLPHAPQSTSITPKYYFHDPQEWDDYDCDYLPLPSPSSVSITPSGVHIPSKSTVNWFVERTSKFFTTHANSHCTLFDCSHSVAPFLVASYLVLVMKAPVKVAIESAGFITTQGSSTTSVTIHDRRLIQELQTRFCGENLIPVPIPPPWFPQPPTRCGGDVEPYKKPSNGFAMPKPRVPANLKRQAEAAAKVGDSKKQRGGTGSSKMVIVDPQGRMGKRVRTVLGELAKAASKSKDGSEDDGFDAESGFPGQMSADIEKVGDLDELTDKYVCTWRACGRRFMMLIISDGVFLVAKDTNEILHCPKMRFPRVKAPQTNQHRTLLDGVLVEDKGEGSVMTKRFLIFDVLAHEGGVMAWRSFGERQLCIIKGIVEPRKKLEVNGGYDFSDEPVRIRRKDFFDMSKASHLMDSFVPKLTHGSSGFIFVNKDHRYVVGKEGDKGKRWLSWKEGEGEVVKEQLKKKIQDITKEEKSLGGT